MKRIVALDPGGTTGWATWQDEATGHTGTPWDHFNIGQIGPEEHHLELYNWLGHLQVHDYTVVCESFEFRQHDGERAGISLISKEYIGVAKLFAAERMNGKRVVEQTAGQAKPFVTNDKLKVMGLYIPGKKHAMDAMRHLVLYLITREGRKDLVQSWRNL